MASEPDWENARVRPVPISEDEERRIKLNPRFSWGYRTIKVMGRKDPEAVYASGLAHTTLTGTQWREIRRQESGWYREAIVADEEGGIAWVAGTGHSRRSRRVKAASARSGTDPSGGSREMLGRQTSGLTRGLGANRNDLATESAQREMGRLHGGDTKKKDRKWWAA